MTEVATEAYATNHSGNTGPQIPVIDYEGSQYQTDFWVGQGRDYEDMVERMVLARLLPPADWQTGKRIAEIGAGFGRLADMYTGYDQIILFDYSRTLLQEAAQKWGDDDRFVFVAGNIYDLPLATDCLDTLVMVRVMHHLADVPSALCQLKRATHPDGIGILEYANKRNLKAMLRWAIKKQDWSPFDQQPVEFVELNFDFHPTWMAQQLTEVDYQCKHQLAVSHFRLPLLKERISPKTLSQLDSYLFTIGGKFPIAPSVFLRVEDNTKINTNTHTQKNRQRSHIETNQTSLTHLFRCPVCHATGEPSKDHDSKEFPVGIQEEQHTLVMSDEHQMKCTSCQSTYVRQGLVWDFKTAL